MATSIDDNEADEKSDKPRCQLINIRCTRAFAQAGAPVFFILRCFAVMQISVHPTAA